MENREILIANTKTQKREKLTTDATTLGELKAAMDAAGIDYNGMTFTEGISKTQLLDDATQLPQNVMYKGAPTNNLVILLTNTKKNIASGTMSRQEAYELIKKYSLQEEVKNRYNGHNFTQVPTAGLIAVIEECVKTVEPSDSVDSSMSAVPTQTPEIDDDDLDDDEDYNDNDYDEDDEEDDDEENTDYDDSNALLGSLYNCITSLVELKQLSIAEVAHFTNILEDYLEAISFTPSASSEPVSTSDGKITDEDIDDMLDNLGY